MLSNAACTQSFSSFTMNVYAVYGHVPCFMLCQFIDLIKYLSVAVNAPIYSVEQQPKRKHTVECLHCAHEALSNAIEPDKLYAANYKLE